MHLWWYLLHRQTQYNTNICDDKTLSVFIDNKVEVDICQHPYQKPYKLKYQGLGCHQTFAATETCGCISACGNLFD